MSVPVSENVQGLCLNVCVSVPVSVGVKGLC